MSAPILRVQNGKHYVTREGKVVRIDGPTGRDDGWKWYAQPVEGTAPGARWMVTDAGTYWRPEDMDIAGRLSERRDIVRPVLEAGHEYITRGGEVVTIKPTVLGDNCLWPWQLCDQRGNDLPPANGQCQWVDKEGFFFQDHSRHMRDIVDYAPVKLNAVGANAMREMADNIRALADAHPLPPLVCKGWGLPKVGKPNMKLARSFMIQNANASSLPINFNNIPKDKPVRDDNIGKRVRFTHIYAGEPVVMTGIIKFEDGTYYAVELDQVDPRLQPWDCNGHVPSKRGWFIPHRDAEFLPDGWAVAETSTEDTPTDAAPPATDRRLLPASDRKLLWDLYVSEHDIDTFSMEDLIEVRRQLDAACER